MAKRKYSKYIAGFYTGTRFCVCIKSNKPEAITVEAEANNYELRQNLPAIKKGNKRINPEYKVLRHITSQLNFL